MKKKIFMITLAACLIVLSIAGSSLAYFTDTDAKTMVFTAGKVEISLDFTDISELKLFPGQSYDYPAKVTNTGTEKAYVGAIITITGTNLSNVIADTSDTDNIPVAITSLLEGLGTNAKVVINGTTCTVYVVNDSAVAKNATYNVFSKITVPASWNHNEVNALTGANITVKAYATQTVGFETATAAAALKAAFPTEWAAY